MSDALEGITKVMTRHLLERGSLIDAWPEDEREAYRTARDYDEREDAVLELRIGKILSELAPLLAAAQAEALREAAEDFEDNMGVGEFDEWARRDGRRWTHIDEAWEHQGPYMDWLRARADQLTT